MLERIIEADADIVLLSETNAFWASNLESLEQNYPHQHLLPLEEHNGMLFYSRLPIDSVDVRYLCQDHIPSLAIDLSLETGRELRIFAIHPRPPRPEDAVQDLDNELEIVAQECRDHDGPVLVMGDFNEVGWSPSVVTFQKRSGLLDPKRGRGIYNSYSAKNILMRWPLDHIFATGDFSVVAIERLSACGSDHFPVRYRFALKA